VDSADRTVGLAAARDVEAAELLRVVAALRNDGLLTEAEYSAKRRHLRAVR